LRRCHAEGPDECAINEDLFGIRGMIRSHLTVAHPSN
jgi:hypothetical protein